jgi:hypothetical protein
MRYYWENFGSWCYYHEVCSYVQQLIKEYRVPSKRALWRLLNQRGNTVSYKNTLRLCKELRIYVRREPWRHGCMTFLTTSKAQRVPVPRLSLANMDELKPIKENLK